MNFAKIMHLDQQRKELFFRRFRNRKEYRELTEFPHINDHLLRIAKNKEFKVEWIYDPSVEIHTLPELRLSIIDSDNKQKCYVQEEEHQLEIFRDCYGNEVGYYYYEPENILFLRKMREYHHHVTIFEWDYHETRYKLFRQLESIDGWLRFEGMAFSSKAVITIITKSELRHMYE